MLLLNSMADNEAISLVGAVTAKWREKREKIHHAHIIHTHTPYIIYTLLFHNGFNVAHVST